MPGSDSPRRQSPLGSGPTGPSRALCELRRADSRRNANPHNSRTVRAMVERGVLEVSERLEPTIGLEPMTCRLRTDAGGEPSTTQPTSDDATPPAFDESPENQGPA